jgi:S1-C subfamily serine protease
MLAFFDAQSPSGVTGDQRLAAHSLVQRARWAVVAVLINNAAGGTGTFISSDGYVVTAGHVVRAGEEHAVVTYDGRQFPATLIAHHPDTPDVAILKVDGVGFPFVPIGSTPSTGDLALYVGHPFRLIWAGTGGVVTNIETSGAFDQLRYTNPSDKGASGSTILGLDGDLIGLVSGQIGNALPESVVVGPQNEPLWSALDFHALLETTGFGPTATVVAEFIEKHVPGLVQANRAARSDAVTVDPGFVAPTIPSDLCRICLHWGGLMDWIGEYVVDIPPLQEVLYLEMMAASMLDPDNVTVEERASVRSVGQAIQHAVVEVSVDNSNGTGFFISPDGYFITNAHVIESAQAISVTTFDGRTMTGTVVGSVPEDWVPDLALAKVNTEAETWIPLADRASLEELVVGVGHPQNLKWAIYGGRVSYWDPPPGLIPVTPHFQFAAVNVGEGSSGSPVVDMNGELVGVVADGMVDGTFNDQWTYGVSGFVDQIVFWDQASLNAATAGRVGGPRVDVVREFIEARVPGLLATLKR